IVPGDPSLSRVIEAVEYANPELQMPPSGQLPDEAIADLRRWIANGALDPRLESAKSHDTSPKHLTLADSQKHWAYRPIERPHVSTDASNCTNSPIDTFVVAKQMADLPDLGNVSTNSQSPTLAARDVLLRRLTFDLHGLPPTPTELRDFGNDVRPDYYERAVDRLLASPRFGERMARRWLDVARYAESLTLRGFVLPDAWRYRDYCIDVFNSDRPLDQFIAEQVAGDQMTSDDVHARQQQLVAVSFLLMGNTNLEDQDKQQLEMDVIDEQLDTLSRAFLAQTIGCARCHDHKFDPIPTRDYYALAGILKASTVLEHANVSKWISRPLPLPSDEEAVYADLENRINSIDERIKLLESRLEPSPKAAIAVSELPGIVVDDSQASTVGEWQKSDHVKPFIGEGYLHDQHREPGAKSVTFAPQQIPPGAYEVRLAYTAGANRATNVLVRVFSADGESTLRVNQRKPGDSGGQWTSLGRYRFEANGQAYVMVANDDADGHVIVDAVQFLPLTAADALADSSVTSESAQRDTSRDRD
ncbi:MAG: DUF1549 domain-containing protein, partial [Planctomycetales bacterium]|nr:DUF1549 domain-containing protein [Planctomycetales bacterium]